MVSDQKGHATRHESGGGDVISHDSLSGFVSNEHVDHSSVSISSGSGLSGGGDITSDRTLSLDASTSDLNDAASPNATSAGQLLIWDATDGQFENSTLTGGSNISITNGDASITIDGTDNRTRFAEVSGSGTTTFYMDSSTTSVYKKVQLNGSISNESTIDLRVAGGPEVKFASPNGDAYGTGLDSNDCLWHGDGFATSVYQLNQSGSIVSKFNHNDGSGVGVDNNECIWASGNTADSIYQFNQSGSIVTQFSSPCNLPTGIGVDSGNCLWHASRYGSIYQLNQSGSVVSKFYAAEGSQGVGVDSNECIWNAGKRSIYQRNQSGSIVTQFSPPSTDPRGLGVDSNDCLWHADADASSIYKLDQTGSIVKGIESKVSSQNDSTVYLSSSLDGQTVSLTRQDDSVEKAKVEFS